MGYQLVDGGVEMRWFQDFHMKPTAPVDDTAMTERINQNTPVQMGRIKMIIESGRQPGAEHVPAPAAHAARADQRAASTDGVQPPSHDRSDRRQRDRGGIMLSTVIGIVPMMVALPYGIRADGAVLLRPRFDPAMPITNGSALVLDVALAAVSHGAASRDGFSLARRRLPPSWPCRLSRTCRSTGSSCRWTLTQPEDWAGRDPRARWRKWNLIRTGLALAAFVTNIVAAVQLT